MKLKFLIFSYILIFVGFTGENFSAQINAVNLEKCWQFDKRLFTNSVAASDNTIVVFLQNSKLIALNNFGNVIWSTEITGKVISNFIIQDKKIIFLKKDGDRLSQFKIIFLSLYTGIINQEIKISNSSNSENFTIEKSNNLKKILFVSDGKIEFSFNLITNKSEIDFISEAENKFDEKFFLDERSKSIFTISDQKVEKIEKSIKYKVHRVYILDKENIIFLDDVGSLTSINLTKMKKNWSFRTGAKINSVNEYKNSLVINSFDNYLYAISRLNGKLLWKKRIDGRSEVLIDDNSKHIFVSLINGQNTFVIELEKGKTVNQITISENNYFISKPISSEDLIIFVTNNGLLTYSKKSC